MSKQDRQGVRKASDIEQKYGLGKFMYNQRQNNQEFKRDLNTLGDSMSTYKTENDKKISEMQESTDDNFKKVDESINSVAKNLESLSKEIFGMIYPVGAIYISTSSTNPGTLFGGTWEQIKDRFLLAAGSSYSAGATGGAATHTLTANEMPSHNHAPANRDTAGSDTNYKRQFTTNLHVNSDSTGRIQVGRENSGYYAMIATDSGDIAGTDYTSYTGGGKAHNNMPPYLAVYVWKRTK